MFRKVSAVVLFVHDFDRSLAFYRDTLGLEVALLESNFVAFKMDEQDFALQEISAAVEMFNVQMAPSEPQTVRDDRMMLCAKVDNVDAAYETLRAKGVEFLQAPVSQYWGIRAAYFRDPEGNLWEIAHPIEQ